MGVPGRYSLIRAMANASGSMLAQLAICARRGNRNAGNGPAAVRSVQLAEERHSPPGDDAAHLEVRKRDIGDRFEEESLIGVGDEVVAIVEPEGHLALEEISRRDHVPSLSRLWSQLTRQATTGLVPLKHAHHPADGTFERGLPTCTNHDIRR